MQNAVVILCLVVSVIAALRWPFFGALAILLTAILRDTILFEFGPYFFWIHSVEALYIATLVSAVLARPEGLAEFVPRTMVDWGMLGFYLVLLASAMVNGVDIYEHKYIDLFFHATVLYFLLSRLADTPRRVAIMAATILVPTAYLAFLAWSKYRAGIVRYARPYYISSFHIFGLQMALTLPLIGALLAKPFRLPTRAVLLALPPVLLLVWLGSQSRTEFVMISLALGAGSLAATTSALAVRLGLLGLVPLFVLTAIRTQSRSAYLGIALGLLMLAWFHRKRWAAVLVLALPLVAYAILHQPAAVMMRVTSIWTGQLEPGVKDSSIQGRWEQMRTAMNILSSSPTSAMLGVGPRQFYTQYQEYVSEEDRGDPDRQWTMHSVPLLILCEEGLMGFAVYYGLLVIGSLREATKAIRRTRGDPQMEMVGTLAAAGLMGFLAFLAYGLGQPQMWVINIYATVAMVTAARRVADARLAEREAAEGELPVTGSAAPRGAGVTEIAFSGYSPERG